MTPEKLEDIFERKAERAGQETGPYAGGMEAAYEDAAETVHDVILSSTAAADLISQARQERDRARALAVRLEQELAHLEEES